MSNAENMDTKKPKVKVLNPEEFKSPKLANTFRISYTDSEFTLDFGRIDTDHDSDSCNDCEPCDDCDVKVNIVSRVVLSKSRMSDYVQLILGAMFEYQKEHNVDLGLTFNGDEVEIR